MIKKLSNFGIGSQRQTGTAESILADPDSQTIAFIDEDHREGQLGQENGDSSSRNDEMKGVVMESLSPAN